MSRHPAASASRERHLVIMSIAGFPVGKGATARIYTYARGMQQCGVATHVLCLTTAPDQQLTGTFDNIPYTYLSDGTHPRRGLLAKIAGMLKDGLRVFHLLRQRYLAKQLDAILYYSPEHYIFVLTAWLTARLFRVPFIGERTEYPYTGSGFRQATPARKCFESFVYRCFDGYIVISDFLVEYVRPRLRPNAWLLRVPIVVDTAPFRAAAAAHAPEKIVGYCGVLEDEAQTLLSTFAHAVHDLSDWRLLVIANASEAEQRAYTALAHAVGIGDRLILAIQVGRREMPSTLARAAVMVLPRASGFFSTAGFPTKLGEYLASGRPVVVTATGDIPNYLIDGDNAYLVPPDDHAAFAERLRYVLTHQEEAARVGAQGQEAADAHFHYRTWCQAIAAHIFPGDIPATSAADESTTQA
jgi:glycosyltransferase involved in cell wall biosynthesis